MPGKFIMRCGKGILVSAVMVFFAPTSSFAGEIRYMPFMFEDTMTVTTHTDMFVAYDTCAPRVPLTLQPKETAQKKVPSFAMMFSKDPEKPQESSTAKKQEPATVQPLILAYGQKSAEKEAQKETLQSLSSVLFAFDSYAIAGGEKKKLIDITPSLKGRKVSVKGYTCDIGSEDYNMKLSQKRADAVGNILSSAGVNVIEIKGMGECCSVSATDKRLNRRTEIKTIQKGGSE